MAKTALNSSGTALWTSSAVNLHSILPGSLGTILFVYAIIVQLINLLIRQHLDVRAVSANLLFAFLFSYLVQFWTHILVILTIPHFNIMVRLLLNILSICGISIATSIYQCLSYLIPVAIIIICLFKTHRLLAVNIGTFFALFFQGAIIGWADLHVFSKLKHRLFLKAKTPTSSH